MLETVKRNIAKKSYKSFDEIYIDYLLKVQDVNILAEMEYIKKHNKIDVLKLDKWIAKELESVVNK